MSNKIGWVKIHRKLLDNDYWLGEPFTRGQAWVDLLLITNFEDGHIRVAGKKIIIKRGQCGWSVLKLADRWKWSRGKVSRFLKELELEGQITRKTDTKTTVLTICNYSEFQKKASSDDTTDGQQTDNKRTSNDTLIKKNKKNKKNKLIEDFEKLWAIYPRTRENRERGDKQKAFKKYTELVESGIAEEDIKSGVERYKAYCEDGEIYNKNFIVWLNSNGYDKEWEVKVKPNQKPNKDIDPKYKPIEDDSIPWYSGKIIKLNKTNHKDLFQRYGHIYGDNEDNFENKLDSLDKWYSKYSIREDWFKKTVDIFEKEEREVQNG